MLSVHLLKQLPGFSLDVDWSAEDGVVALFGPSGAGKTLTLRCLAGLMPLDGGRIVVHGRTLYDSVGGVNQATRDRRLGVVFHGYALFPHLTVEENLGFGLDRLARRARRVRVEELVERLSLGPVRRLNPAALSGGQQQRVALGRALAPDPDLLLLDEPLAALDSPLRRSLREDLGAMLRGFGKTAVVVTHDLAEACQLADQLVVYDQGRVLQSGRTAAVLAHPATPAVAGMLGIRNVLEGIIIDSGRGFARLDWRGHTLTAAGQWAMDDAPAPGSRTGFFVRPEHIRLLRKDRSAPIGERQTNLVTGAVVGEVDLGAAYALRFLLDGGGSAPARGFDLEIEVSKLVHEKLCLHYDREWTVSIQPSAVELLPSDSSGIDKLAPRSRLRT